MSNQHAKAQNDVFTNILSVGSDGKQRSDNLLRIVDSQDGGQLDINTPPAVREAPPPPATSRDMYGIPMGGAAIPV